MSTSKLDDERLVSLQSHDSWLALLEAAKLRKHSPILDIAMTLESGAIPKIFYHRKCRSLFTMKRDLQTLTRKADETSSCEACSSGIASKRASRKSSSEGRVYDPVCIFCNKVKFEKYPRSREKLVQAIQLRADETLRECAKQKEDERILAVTSRDIVAAEAHYHVSCYKKYTKRKQEQPCTDKADNTKETECDERYRLIERESFEELFRYIRTEIIPNKVVVAVASLTSKLESFVQTGGIDLYDSTKKHIRRKLESQLGESVHIFPDEKGKLLMVPDNLLFKDVILENQRLKKELTTWKAKSTCINKILDEASSHIRSVVRQEMKTTPWPCHPSDLNTGAQITIPNELERFLVGLLTGDPDTNVQTQRISTLIQSFSQDIIYAVTCGQHKPPKHLLLPNAIKTLTGNVELIQILNKLGHAISYSQLEENDTALCLQKLAAGSNNKVVLPSAIKPHVFTNIAWDNIDRLEETLTGKGTSHRVNGIAVQANVYGPHLPKDERPQIEKKKQRSVAIAHQELEVYVAGEREGPKQLFTSNGRFQEADLAGKEARNKNLVWMLARQADSENQSTPGWTGFNISTRDKVHVSADIVGYLPTINAPATEMSTVCELLNQSELIRKELLLENVVVVLDQALYAKAAEIVWKHRDRFSNIILRMGTFHTICNALAIIGKRFRDAGLKDICIESGIVAEGSINGVLDGKHYNRAVRIHKYIYEAFMRLAWSEFVVWIEANMNDKSVMIMTFLGQVTEMTSELNQERFDTLLQSPLLTELATMWNDFLEHLRHNNGELSAFWFSYVDLVEIVILGLIRASREGNWDLHLHAIRHMIPWCFAYDKLNYARYLTPYFAQMTNLPDKNPQIFEAFKSSQFSVQMSRRNPFGRIPVDQTTEVTVNKDTQTPGGTVRFSLNAGAIKRYYITAEYRSAFLGQLRDMVQSNKSEICHTELHQTKIQKDEEAVSTIVGLIRDWVNPFSDMQDLVSISTAKSAPRNIAMDLLNAKEIGEEAYANFQADRLESDPPAKKFHDPIKSKKLKTFSNMFQKKEIKSRGRVTILKADRTLFGRIIVMAQGRNLRMEEILSHPLGPLPWALSTPDGFLRKTNKASLATTLQKNVNVAERFPNNCVTVIDAMNLVQRVKGDQNTFGDIATTIFAMALKEGAASDRIDIVFDTYVEGSIKNSERSLRGEEAGHQLQNITSTQIVRQWRNFFSSVKNKTSLITFLVNEWMKEEYRQKLQRKIVYATVIDKCFKITFHEFEEVPDLQCQQEEADGRLLFHAAHAGKEGYQAAEICSEDTDVFIMSLAFSDMIGTHLFQKCGNRTRTRLVDIKKIAAALGIDVCRALIGMHAFTGCDTVSAFAGKGKSGALKLLTKNSDIQHIFLELGQQWDLSLALTEKLERFTCLMYAPKLSSSKVNDLRYDLFCAKKDEIESHQLPPCFDCLVEHDRRANYQAAIWRRCLEQDPGIPSPVGRGWKIDLVDGTEKLVVHWMNGQPAPEAVLDLLACNCARKCTLPNCTCLSNGLKCTDMCRLQDCENQASAFESDNERSADEDTPDVEETDNESEF